MGSIIEKGKKAQGEGDKAAEVGGKKQG